MISKRRELRSDVRTALSYSVNYEIISPEEYYQIKKKSASLINRDLKKSKIAPKPSDNNSKVDFDLTNNSYDDTFVEFLIKMDEKLDTILSMLSTNETMTDTLNSVLLNQGIGNNISASGISIFTFKSANKGNIINMNINLCKLPPIFIDTYGEIVRVTSVYKNSSQMYDLGIKFIDLTEKDREKIVAYVFKKQREILRSEKAC
jgi:hypothetical protein